MWVRWMIESEQRKRAERIRQERESLVARPGRRRERAGRRPKGRR